MQFSNFAQYLQNLEAVSSRLEMTRQLSKLFKELKKDEIAPACYLSLGQLLPSYESVEFQIAVKTVIKALARVSDVAEVRMRSDATSLFGDTDFSSAEAEILAQYKKMGDLGTVAEGILTTKDSKLTIAQVYQRLWDMAKDNGQGSQQRKLEALVLLLRDLDALSAKFVIRIILAKLRLGFSTMTMLDGLSWSMTGDKSETGFLELAFQKRADIGKLAELYLGHADKTARDKALSTIQVEVGVPVVPALCQRLNTSEEIIAKMGEVYAEPKYDGLRAQIHVSKKKSLSPLENIKIKTFTRNLEDSSLMFPELTTILDALKCDECILDSEAIGYSPETGMLLPFQDTITRKRKHGVDEVATQIPVRFYVFDVLSIDGESLIDKPLRERKDRLNKLFNDNEVLYHSPYIETSDPKELHTFHNQQLAEGLEGAVIKQVNSVYQSGRKGWSWVKIKEAEGSRGKLKDTLDCVVMGYYAGRGKRTQFGVGAFLVGVLDKNEDLKTIAKIGTGLSDEQFRELKTRSQKLEVPDKPENYDVEKSLIPDVWLRPEMVVEIAADELTKSPIHTAGQALRFPRLVKFRDDKNWDQATTITELEKIK